MADSPRHQLDRVIEVASMVRADAETDALSLDLVPFTPQGVGQRLGEIYAMLLALAGGLKALAELMGREE